jgi:hypothetical protein
MAHIAHRENEQTVDLGHRPIQLGLVWRGYLHQRSHDCKDALGECSRDPQTRRRTSVARVRTPVRSSRHHVRDALLAGEAPRLCFRALVLRHHSTPRRPGGPTPRGPRVSDAVKNERESVTLVRYSPGDGVGVDRLRKQAGAPAAQNATPLKRRGHGPWPDPRRPALYVPPVPRHAASGAGSRRDGASRSGSGMRPPSPSRTPPASTAASAPPHQTVSGEVCRSRPPIAGPRAREMVKVKP